MAQKQIIWSKKAEEELIAALEYYNNRNKSTAYSLKLLDRIEQKTELIIKNNFLGRLAEDGQTRILIVDEFLILYQVEEKHLEVVSFWHNKQNPGKKIDQ